MTKKTSANATSSKENQNSVVTISVEKDILANSKVVISEDKGEINRIIDVDILAENSENGNAKKLIFDKDLLETQTGKKEIEKVSITEKEQGERKERARETISFVLVFGLLGLFLVSFVFAGTVDDAIKLIQAIAAALSGLIGAVLGYYFGATTAEKKIENESKDSTSK